MTIQEMQGIILSYQSYDGGNLFPRELSIHRMPKKATIILGGRRIGKTQLFWLQIQNLRKQGVPSENICYIDFFHPLLSSGKGYTLMDVEKAYYSLYPENIEKDVYFFLDEIQLAPNWGSWISWMLETHRCVITCTGSSAHALSVDIPTELRGRSLSWRMYPLSFAEFLGAHGKDVRSSKLSEKEKHTIEMEYQRYEVLGSFPEMINPLPAIVRNTFYSNYFDLVCLRDVVERYSIKNPTALKALAHALLICDGTLQSFSRLHHRLQSSGYNITLAQVSEYIGYLKDAFFVYDVPPFGSYKDQLLSAHKYYIVDHGLVQSFTSLLPNQGMLLENMVYMHLVHLDAEVFFWKDKQGKETDFVLRFFEDQKLSLVQVCYTFEPHDATEEREVSALRSSMAFFKKKASFLVTREKNKTIETEEGVIHVIDAPTFFLMISFGELRSSFPDVFA